MKRIKNSGVKADVLDIGTGSGILAMMAAASGADYVTACEVSVCNAFSCQQNYVILYQLTIHFVTSSGSSCNGASGAQLHQGFS